MDKKGKTDNYRVLLELDGALEAVYVPKDEAMAIAKRMDEGENLDAIVCLRREDGKVRHAILTKEQAKHAALAVTVETAINQCWTVLGALPESEAKKVLAALKLRVSPEPEVVVNAVVAEEVSE